MGEDPGGQLLGRASSCRAVAVCGRRASALPQGDRSAADESSQQEGSEQQSGELPPLELKYVT